MIIKKDYEDEIKVLEDKHCHELTEFEERIKRILKRKEDEIFRLNEDVHIKESLCKKYEELLERQKRELLGG